MVNRSGGPLRDVKIFFTVNIELLLSIFNITMIFTFNNKALKNYDKRIIVKLIRRTRMTGMQKNEKKYAHANKKCPRKWVADKRK